MWLRSRRVPIWQQRRFPPSLKPPLKFVGKQVDAHPTWSFVIVSALALFLYALFSTQRVILIENIAVPKAIEELGFSSTALTSQVRSAIIHIDSEVPESRGGKARSSFRGNDEKESPDFEIPGTKIGQ